MLNHGWRRWHGENEYSLTTKNTKRHESNNRNEARKKIQVSELQRGDSRNNSLTQVFAFFVYFRAFRGK